VIGGGVVGCSVAYRLAGAGLAVTVVDRGSCGGEASWAGAGIILPGSATRADPLAVMRRASIARFEAFAGELRERTGIDPEYIRCGGLDLITDDNQDAAADREAAAWEGRVTDTGEAAVRRLDRKQARRLEPQLTGRIRGAVLNRLTAQVRSPRILAALRSACVQAGVAVREHTPVTGLMMEGSRVTGVRCGGHSIDAGHVVIAAGAWSSDLAPALRDALEVFPVRGQIALLEMSPLPFLHFIIHGRSYLVPRRDGKILVGSTEERGAGFDKRNTTAGVAKLLATAERFVPVLKDATLLRVWSGLRPATPDSKPYIGPVPGFEGLLAATGHFRSGLSLAPITADLITQHITTGETELDLTPFLPGRATARA
jgi:glycine oxidase